MEAFVWQEGNAARKKMPAGKRFVSCCSWRTSAAWTTSRGCSRRRLPNSWETASMRSWTTNWATAGTTTKTRTQTTAGTDTAADPAHQLRRCGGICPAGQIPPHRRSWCAGSAAVSVPAVVCVLVFVVVPAVAQFVVQLRIEAVSHEFGNRLLEQPLDVVHAADVRQLQQLTNLFPAGIFFRAAFPSCHTKASILVLLLYTTFEVYTKYGIVSHGAVRGRGLITPSYSIVTRYVPTSSVQSGFPSAE